MSASSRSSLMGVAATTQKAQAMTEMARMMALPEHDEHGKPTPFPTQVKKLQELHGCDGGEVSREAGAQSSSGKELKRAEQDSSTQKKRQRARLPPHLAHLETQ
ncbi:MAG: hypothetical protein SGPRY_012141, partial [Prymnesium sp.]